MWYKISYVKNIPNLLLELLEADVVLSSLVCMHVESKIIFISLSFGFVSLSLCVFLSFPSAFLSFPFLLTVNSGSVE